VELTAEDLQPDPLGQLAAWYEDAVARRVPEADAMALATADAAGRPSVRIMLLKGIAPDGVRFFTNYESRKGRELLANPRGALAIHWAPLGRQVRLEGPVEPLPADESDAYYASRPLGSRLGAWASRQGTVLASREELEARVRDAEARYADGPPRPAYWGGFRLAPEAIEFWQARTSRLHDRFHYLPVADGGWRIERLSP
jgi:pyridoxamine 5'-phosphate oxidase